MSSATASFAIAHQDCRSASGVMVVSCTGSRRLASLALISLHRDKRGLLVLDDTTRAGDPNAWAYVGISSRPEGAKVARESRVRNAVCSQARICTATRCSGSPPQSDPQTLGRGVHMGAVTLRNARSKSHGSLRRLSSRPSRTGARRCVRLESDAAIDHTHGS
jgi:hypothetical protein